MNNWMLEAEFSMALGSIGLSVAGQVLTKPRTRLKEVSESKTSGFLTDKIRTPLEASENAGNLRSSSSYKQEGSVAGHVA